MSQTDGESQKVLRGRAKTKLSTFINYLNSFKDGSVPDPANLSVRLEKLDETFNEFDEIQHKIEESVGEKEQELEIKVRVEFENKYFDAVAKARSFLPQYKNLHNTISNNNSHQNVVNPTSNKTEIKLPALNLPSFSGTFSGWLSFYDSFKSLVHTNEHLTKLQKFQYLKSCLEGDAARPIDTLPLTESNYDSAIKILQKRYGNRRLIVQEHVAMIINLPAIQKSSGVSLRQLLDTIGASTEALRILEIPVDSWDALIVPLIKENSIIIH